MTLHYILYACVNEYAFVIFQRIVAQLHAGKTPPYVINLDPAVHEVPFPANIG